MSLTTRIREAVLDYFYDYGDKTAPFKDFWDDLSKDQRSDIEKDLDLTIQAELDHDTETP